MQKLKKYKHFPHCLVTLSQLSLSDSEGCIYEGRSIIASSVKAKDYDRKDQHAYKVPPAGTAAYRMAQLSFEGNIKYR